jgi:transposase
MASFVLADKPKARSPYADDIIRLLGEGKSSKEICAALGCSRSTVSKFRERGQVEVPTAPGAAIPKALSWPEFSRRLSLFIRRLEREDGPLPEEWHVDCQL